MAVRVMSVHEALNELKLIKDKIEKGLNVPLAAVKQNNRLNGVAIDEPDFIKATRAAYQRHTALIRNYRAIKQAVVRSNASTTVVIGEREMTVAAAIEYRRDSIEMERALLNAMTRQYDMAVQQVSRNRQIIMEQAEKAAQAAFGQHPDKNADEYRQFVESFVRRNEITLVDPLNLKEEIERYSANIAAFESRVNVVLTASNASTMIEVELED